MVKLDRRWIIRRLPHELFEENVLASVSRNQTMIRR